MSAWLVRGGLEQLLSAGINIPTDNIKLVLVRLASLSAVKAITGATNATPIAITCTGHGLTTGDLVAIVQVGGNTAANGKFAVTVSDANTFTLQDIATGDNIAGSGAYTSGGLMIPLNSTALDNLDDVDAAAIAGNGTSGNLASKTVTDGVFDAADVDLTSVTAASGGSTCDGILFYKDTGTPSTSPLFLLLDQNGGTGLPVTPNGGNISIQFSSGTYKIAALRG